MKAIGLLCALTALAACSESDDPAKARREPARGAQAGWALEPGTYEYAHADGGAGLLVLDADGSYSDVISGGELETGAWGQEQGLSCLVPASGVKRCYRFIAPDAQGRFRGTNADGETTTARKLE